MNFLITEKNGKQNNSNNPTYKKKDQYTFLRVAYPALFFYEQRET